MGSTFNKVAVVTANIGGIDAPKDIPAQSVDFQRFYITEDSSGVAGTDREKALWYKCNLWDLDTGADVNIWLDGKIQVLSYDFIQQILESLGTADLAIMKHLYRSCIYQEVDHIEHCIRHNNAYLATRYRHKPIRRQVEAYRYFGYPAGAGLFDCCIIAMRPGLYIQNVYKAWWNDVYNLKGFDQVALPFYAWLHKVKIQPIEFKPASFKDVPHIK